MCLVQQVSGGRVAPKHFLGSKVANVSNGSKVSMMSRWKGMDAGQDQSDDQMDIARGKGMVDSKFQGGSGLGGTQVSSPPFLKKKEITFFYSYPRQEENELSNEGDASRVSLHVRAIR